VIPLTEIVTGRETRSLRTRLARAGFKTSINMPTTAVLNITLRCPLRCVYCYSDSGKLYDLNFDYASRFLVEFSKSGGKIVILSGGEPTLHPNILDLVDLCNELGVFPVISSCGIVEPDLIKSLAERSVKYIGVSVDTGLTVLESKLRRGVNLEKVFETIHIAKKLGIDVGVRSTLTITSLVALENLFKLCEKLQIDRLCIYFLVPSGRALHSYNLSVSSQTALRVVIYLIKLVQLYSNIDTLLVTNPSVFVFTCLYISSSKEEFFSLLEMYSERCRCNAASRLISVNVRGEILPCQFAPSTAICGTLDNLDLAQAVLRGREWISKHRCRSCLLSDLCLGCPVRLHVTASDRDPLCLLESLTKVEIASISGWKTDLAKRLLTCTQHHA